MKKYNIFITSLIIIVVVVLTTTLLVKNDAEYSNSERRSLAQKPAFTWTSVLDGKFADDYETYLLDQFPFRESFRKLKAAFSYDVLLKSDNNGVFCKSGQLSKVDYPLKPFMLEYAIDRFNRVNDTYLKDSSTNVYFCIVPDKNYYLTKGNHLSIDYDEIDKYMADRISFAEFIDIKPMLSADDYYKTDTHWRQECLPSVVGKIADTMGANIGAKYEMKSITNPFYGVYAGQYALKTEPDTLNYLMSDTLSECIVTNYDTGEGLRSTIYDFEKAAGKDPYEFFMSGNSPLIVVENPNAKTEKELVVFRDSFASSLVPLLVEGYEKITLVDLRYIDVNSVGEYIEFSDQDVLFLYSTLLLNNSMSII